MPGVKTVPFVAEYRAKQRHRESPRGIIGAALQYCKSRTRPSALMPHVIRAGVMISAIDDRIIRLRLQYYNMVRETTAVDACHARLRHTRFIGQIPYPFHPLTVDRHPDRAQALAAEGMPAG